MSKKSFNLCIVMHIVEVHCPGTWICPKGMVYLDIWIFGQNNSTRCVEPKFPLDFNETFNFHKNFTDISNLNEMHKKLDEKYMRIALVQVYEDKRITLATFNGRVNQVLYPTLNFWFGSNGETTLLMKNESIFQGTITPKVVIVTRTSITEEIHPVPCDNQSWPEFQNKFNGASKIHDESREKNIKQLNSKYHE